MTNHCTECMLLIQEGYEVYCADCVTRLEEENKRLSDKLDLAVGYLREGKAKFAPNTTNSLVDSFLNSFLERIKNDS